MIERVEREEAPAPVIRGRRLARAFGATQVLRGLDIEVPCGAVYGLVGLNGAGKTTTLESLLGLLPGLRGEASVLGEPPTRVHRLGSRVGVVFDGPSLRPSLTVRQALRHAAMVAGPNAATPEETEELLGIRAYAQRKVRKLSLGNRRRTAIAAALVGRPELVILDEPFSGLDAGGIEDVLELIDVLRRETNVTFLLSSHQLHHVERVSTHLGVIHDGRMTREGTVESLLAGERPTLFVRVSDFGRARSVLAALPGVGTIEAVGDDGIECCLDGVDPARANRLLVEAGVNVSELTCRRPSLARLFRAWTLKSESPPAAGEEIH